MTYATATDLLNRFSAEEIAQRADRSRPRRVDAELLAAAAVGADLSGWLAAEQEAAVAALALINQALADADGTIDGYVSGRGGVPLPVPAMVKQLACDLARYALYDDQATETIQKRRDAAQATLRDISTGKVSLGVPAAAAPVQTGAVEMSSAPAVWRREDSQGFI